MDLLDDTSSADGVNLSGLDNLESDVAIVLVVGHARQGGANASMDVCVVLQQALHGRMVEIRAYRAKSVSQFRSWASF